MTIRTLMLVIATTGALPAPTGAQEPFARVRSTNAEVASLIAQAKTLSATFRGLVDVIDTTDGLV